MGGAVSAGDSNDELVDNLIQENFIRSENVKEVFRAVDRGSYYLPQHRSTAYHDMAWKHQNLHLSAPCIYSEVMEHLDLKPGLSFLNIGSGTGYINTMVGLILGPTGVNHGIEIHKDVVEYANERLRGFIEFSLSFDWFDFCSPQFVCGNGLKIPIDTPGYDRIYCGADCPVLNKSYMSNLLNINGVMVVPMDDHLDVIKRTGQSSWDSKAVMSVSFASLLQPPTSEPANLPKRYLPTLYNLCRYRIRRAIRDHCSEDITEEKQKRQKMKKKSKKMADGGEQTSKHSSDNICVALNQDTVSSSDSEQDEDTEQENNSQKENLSTSSPNKGINNSNKETTDSPCSSSNKKSNLNTNIASVDAAADSSHENNTTGDMNMETDEVVFNSKEDTVNAYGDESSSKKIKSNNGGGSDNAGDEEEEDEEMVGSSSDIPSSNSHSESSVEETDDNNDEDDDNRPPGLQRSILTESRMRMFHNLRYSSRNSAERGMMTILSSVLRRRRPSSKTLTLKKSRKRMKPVDPEVEEKSSMSEEEEEIQIRGTSFTQSIISLPLPPVIKQYLLYNRVEID